MQRADDSQLYLAVVEKNYVHLPEQYRQNAAGIIITHGVENINEAYDRFYLEGQTLITEIIESPTGRKYFGIEDPNGLVIAICENVEGDFYKDIDLIINPFGIKKSDKF